MARRPKCFVIIRRGNGNAFFPVDRKATRKAAERAKRVWQRTRPGTYAVRNVCGLGDGAPAAPAAISPSTPPTPAAKPVAGWWPFTKKKPKRNPMTETIYWVPGGRATRSYGAKSGGSSNPMARRGASIRGARRRKRRR